MSFTFYCDKYRKSLDGLYTIVYKDFITPIGEDETFPEYKFNSQELKHLIDSEKWMKKE